MLERRQNARRERRRAAALDQPDQRVQIDAALAREVVCQFPVETGLAQSRSAPRDNVGRSSPEPCPFFGTKVHVSLAHASAPFLPSARRNFARTPRRRGRGCRGMAAPPATPPRRRISERGDASGVQVAGDSPDWAPRSRDDSQRLGHCLTSCRFGSGRQWPRWVRRDRVPDSLGLRV